jgi:hypothetical protein
MSAWGDACGVQALCLPDPSPLRLLGSSFRDSIVAASSDRIELYTSPVSHGAEQWSDIARNLSYFSTGEAGTSARL